MKMGVKYLVNTVTAWNEPPRARHQLTEALSKSHEVLFVEANKFGFPKIEIKKINRNLTLITPFFPAPRKLRLWLPFVNEIYQIWLFRQLSKLFDGEVIHVINFDPVATQIFRYFSDVIYYCNDDFLITGLRYIPPLFVYRRLSEQKVAENSRFCVGVNGHIVSKLKKYNPTVYLLPLAVSSSVFEFEKGQVSEYLHVKPPIIYVGFIDWRFDFSIISDLCAEIPDREILLVGPVNTKVPEEISKMSNVRFVGSLDGQSLYSTVQGSVACIIPFKKCEFTEKGSVMLNKSWLYLAFGKPIISVDMPDNPSEESGLIYLCKNKDEFALNTLKAIREDNAGLKSKRISFARQNTWDDRVNQLIRLYGET